jgi:DNA-binding transcriptional MocR family regulator
VRPIRQIAVFGPLGTDNVVELIVQRLRAVIGVGILEHGELLPSEPEMSEQFGVAVFSIREALAQLRGEGLIVTKRGRYGGQRRTADSGAGQPAPRRAPAADVHGGAARYRRLALDDGCAGGRTRRGIAPRRAT